MPSKPPPIPQWYLDKIKHDAKVLKSAGSPAKKKKSKQNKKKKGWAPGLFQTVGAGLGSWSGIPGGSDIGRKAGQWFAEITGSGAYKVNSNSLLSSGNQVPMFKSGLGTTRLRHREFITDVISSSTPGAFGITNYAINPGLVGTFPWLSSIANNYEQYQFHGLIFEFKTTSSDALNSVNTALGTVVMATEYDVADSGFTNKQQMEAYEYSSSTKPSLSVVHPVECDPRQNTLRELYVRSGDITRDPRFFDLGNFQIATVGLQGSAVNIGELWVSYDIELFKPKISTPLGVNIPSAHFTSGPLISTIFGTTVTRQVGSSIPCTFTNNSCTILYPGNYLVVYSGSAATTWTSTGGMTAGAGCTLLKVWNYNGTFDFNVEANATNTANFVEAAIVSITPVSGGTFSISNPTTVGAASCDLWIGQISSALLT
jgi:hypothetical protein